MNMAMRNKLSLFLSFMVFLSTFFQNINYEPPSLTVFLDADHTFDPFDNILNKLSLVSFDLFLQFLRIVHISSDIFLVPYAEVIYTEYVFEGLLLALLEVVAVNKSARSTYVMRTETEDF